MNEFDLSEDENNSIMTYESCFPFVGFSLTADEPTRLCYLFPY